jgi:hypothetical protein
MHKFSFLVLLFSLGYGCSDADTGSSFPLPVSADVVGHIDLGTGDIEETIEEPDTYLQDCITCEWYFCPPLNAVWQKEICIDYCTDPATVYSASECEEHLECDPSQYFMGEVLCETEEGYPGTAEKVCDKGYIKYKECETECLEEVCDYEDNDCDDLIDEGQRNACDLCGILPSETCNGVDDDCNGQTDEELIHPCSTACGEGYEFCSQGNWISCNAPPVFPEICDGIDNNCDGNIDEDLDCICKLKDVGTMFPCFEPPLLCGQGYKTCECTTPSCEEIIMTECYAFCSYLPEVPPDCDPLIGMAIQIEVCNNFDENCNDLIDEDLYDMCYTGPEGTIGIGECTSGYLTCLEGTWGNYQTSQDEVAGLFTNDFCKDEITPQTEICNGLDDDCDGITDYGEEIKDTDILLIVDWSGSMIEEITAVLTALNQFALKFSDETKLQWAVIIGPISPGFPTPQFLKLHHHFSGFTDFMTSMSGLGLTSVSGSKEMLYDALYLSLANIANPAYLAYDQSQMAWISSVGQSDPPIDQFKLNWRPDVNRIIIMFSDEVGQSFVDGDLNTPAYDKVNKQILLDAMAGTPKLNLYTFATYEWEWDILSLSTGGKHFTLTSNPTEMYAGLMEILDEVCQGGDSP